MKDFKEQAERGKTTVRRQYDMPAAQLIMLAKDAETEGIYKALCQAYYAGIDNGYRQAIRDTEKDKKAKGIAVSSKALVSIADRLGITVDDMF